MKHKGLGLAIIARIVKNMNGQLRVESELNKGSRFAVTLSFPLHLPSRKSSTDSDAAKPGTTDALKFKNPNAAESLTPLSYIEGKLMMMKAQLKQEKKQEFATTTPKFHSQGKIQQGSSVSSVSINASSSAENNSAIQTPRLVVLYAEVFNPYYRLHLMLKIYSG